MNIERVGLILYVRKYEECVIFYTDILKLPILFKNEDLTCFDCFGTYIMVEKEERFDGSNEQAEMINHSCLRINVKNVKSISESLKIQNIKIDNQEHSWGIVAKFKDPEGNLIAFKDEGSFAKQIEDYNN